MDETLKLPPRTVERLSKYRRLLYKYRDMDEAHIFSHRLAELLNLSPEQVRRDLMLIGLTGNHRKGYNIRALIEQIGKIIDLPPTIYQKNYDIITSLEEIGFFIRA